MSPGPTHADGPMAFVASLDAPVLSNDDRHHLSRVLRVRNGAPMVVCDGDGSWRPAVFSSIEDAELETAGGTVFTPLPSPAVAVSFALIKGDRPELVVQKLTELGVDRFGPFDSAHCVVRWDERKASKQAERMTRIAREAAMQCRRTHLPAVEPFGDITALAAAWAAAGERFVRADMGGVPLAVGLGAPQSAGSTVRLAIGPEGGWSAAERDLASAVSVGDHILRAETAAIAAAVLLAAWRASGS